MGGVLYRNDLAIMAIMDFAVPVARYYRSRDGTIRAREGVETIDRLSFF